jgi:hypothetical protein
MIIHITPIRKVFEIQQEFNEVFPYLKIEFFADKPFYNNGQNLAQLIANNKSIGEAQRRIIEGELEVNESTRVNELESKLRDNFTLNAKVFRKSGNLWIEAIMTDAWTLKQQNTHGEEISTMEVKLSENHDYDFTKGAND